MVINCCCSIFGFDSKVNALSVTEFKSVAVVNLGKEQKLLASLNIW